MAAPPVNGLKSLVVWLNDIFKVIAQQLQDVEAKKEALRALGLNPAGANQSLALPAGALASIQQYADKGDDEVDIEAFLSVIADVISVAQAIDDFVHLVSDTEDPEIVGDFVDLLLQLYLMDAIRLRLDTTAAKIFFGISQAIDAYQELGTPSGGVFGFTKNLVGFIRTIGEAVNVENEQEAARLTDTFFVLLAIASFFVAPIRNNLTLAYGDDPLPSPPAPPSPTPNADAISRRTLTAALTFAFENEAATQEITASLFLSLAVRPQVHPGFPIAVLLGGAGTFEQTLDNWKLSVSVLGVPDVDLRFAFGIERAGEQSPLVIGDPTGTNLTIGAPSFRFSGSIADQDVDIKINTKQGAFVLKKGKTDGFLNSIMPEKGIFGAFDLGVGYSVRKGLYVDGGSGLTVLVPLHTTLGPIVLNSFFLKAAGNTTGDGVLVETSIGMTADFLGFKATVERIGLQHNLSLPADGRKNLGFINYDIAFKPPNGVGLALDVGILKGGGFLYFDFDKGEYFGGIELAFQGLFTLKCIGIINTKMPDGSPGFSLLIIITAEFSPIQLGFGFTLIGVGGLLGVNRTARIDVLREGIKTNTLKSILFPEDIVANMSRIISDLRQVFPVQPGRFLVGPMAKLGYGTPPIITLELGILLEIPAPRIAILGVLKALLPDEKAPVLRLQVNFLGVLDFENKYISFDASIYDSRLLTFVLSGDMAFRLSWGSPAVFLLSVGGFHPAFTEIPADLQNMTRLTISLLSGENPRITARSYFAVTSNTAQFGARVELYAAAAGFNVYGFVGFDVLFQFVPFSFIATIGAGVALRRGSSVLMSLQLSGQFSGPRPWDVRGQASFSILFFDVTVGFHETWGQPPPAIESETADLTQMLTAEVNDNRNWKAEPPDRSTLHVSIRKFEPPAGRIVVHPFGVLSFSERLLPLEVTVQRFGTKAPKDANRFAVVPTDTGVRFDTLTELFAAANFLTLNDSQKLSRKSFEPMRSGFRITGSGAVTVPAMVSKSVDYELTYVRRARGLSVFAGIYTFAKALFKATLRGGAVSQSALSFANSGLSANAPEAVTVRRDSFAVVSTTTMQLHGENAIAGSYTEADQLMSRMVAEDPSLAGRVQVVAAFEMANRS